MIDMDVILYVCGAIVSISAAVGIISKSTRNIVDKSTKSAIQNYLSAYSSTYDSKIDELKDKIQEYVENQQANNEDVRKALMASTRDRINQAHDYYVKRKYIGAHSLFVVEELYSSYKRLGGNSFVDRQMEDIRELEVRSAEIEFDSSNK